MYDLVTFGEAMIRLSPPNAQRLEQTATLDVQIGGAEYSVAVAGARLGLKTAWVSRLPDNALGRRVANKAREHGVDTSHIVWAKEGRVGLYFLEFGASPRPSSVMYDRSPSAIADIQAGEVDWKKVLKGSKRFHTTGITPALSAGAADATKEALEAAKAAGAQVSYDLNFRKKLWSAERARQVQEPLMRTIDLLITNEEDPKAVFGIEAGPQDASFKTLSGAAYRSIAEQLQKRFNVPSVAISLRESPSVLKNNWSACLWHQGAFHEGPRYELEIVDRLGGGDSFAAGLLYGLITSGDSAYALRFGVAFSALKHTTPGDINWATRQETEALMQGGGVRVER
jgi:2-dehydro-3-deoxygluconokinase